MSSNKITQLISNFNKPSGRICRLFPTFVFLPCIDHSSDISFADPGDDLVFSTIISIDHMTVPNANALWQMYTQKGNEASASDFSNGALRLYRAGYYGDSTVLRSAEPHIAALAPMQRDMISKMDDLREQLQEALAEGIYSAGESYQKAEKNPTSEGGVRYSVVAPFADNSGVQYDSAVLLDTWVFDGISPRNWGEKLKDYVQFRASTDPFILPVVDENGVAQQLVFANLTDRVYKTGKTRHKVLDELSETSDNISKLAVIHIDEILDVAEKDNPYFTRQDQTVNHLWLDKKGWLHCTAYVINAKNGGIYRLVVDIAKTDDDRHIMYATKGKINRVGTVQVSSLKNRGSGHNPNSYVSLSQQDPTVKRKDWEYQYAVNRGDLKSAQRMVDTAAKDAGYTIMAYHGTTNKEEHSTWNAERRSWDTTYTPISVITTHLLYLLYFL